MMMLDNLMVKEAKLSVKIEPKQRGVVMAYNLAHHLEWLLATCRL